VPPLCVDCRLAGIPPDFPITNEQKDEFFDMVEPMERLFLLNFETYSVKPPYPAIIIDCVHNSSLNSRVKHMLGLQPPSPPTGGVREVAAIRGGTEVNPQLDEMDEAFWGAGSGDTGDEDDD